jgi:hypothetical protein
MLAISVSVPLTLISIVVAHTLTRGRPFSLLARSHSEGYNNENQE